MNDPRIHLRGWRYKFNSEDIFITVLAPCYPHNHARYTFNAGTFLRQKILLKQAIKSIHLQAEIYTAHLFCCNPSGRSATIILDQITFGTMKPRLYDKRFVKTLSSTEENTTCLLRDFILWLHKLFRRSSTTASS
jgi:hypothetical protein